METLLERFGGFCVYCGKPGTDIDHLDPVSRGGRTTPGNVVTACKSCNSRKRDKPLEQWLDELQARGPLPEILIEVLAFHEASLWG